MQLWTVAFVATLALAAGCGSPCGDYAASDADNAPRLVGMKLVQRAVPSDPWQLVFVLDFRDKDGDLSGGFAQVFLNGKRHESTVALLEIFRQSALANDATSGQLTLPLRFDESSVSDGAKVELAVQVVDSATLRSNCYSMDLEFSVKTASHTPVAPRVLWAGACSRRRILFDG